MPEKKKKGMLSFFPLILLLLFCLFVCFTQRSKDTGEMAKQARLRCLVFLTNTDSSSQASASEGTGTTQAQQMTVTLELVPLSEPPSFSLLPLPLLILRPALSFPNQTFFFILSENKDPCSSNNNKYNNHLCIY